MDIKIVDTTLRDGEQKPGIALGVNEKIHIAQLLDRLGIFQIEAGIPAMGGSERKSIQKIVELNLKSKISAWNRMNPGDIRLSTDCNVDIIHISVPASDIQIYSKMNRSRQWVADCLKKCIYIARERGFEVTVGFEDASRADGQFLQQLIELAVNEGAMRVRYADTVGILYRRRVFEEIKTIKDRFHTIDVEIHAHNDLGMAVSNSISAVKAGSAFVNCTIGGIGERAGNCDYLHFMQAAKGCLGLFKNTDFKEILMIQQEILRMMK